MYTFVVTFTNGLTAQVDGHANDYPNAARIYNLWIDNPQARRVVMYETLTVEKLDSDRTGKLDIDRIQGTLERI